MKRRSPDAKRVPALAGPIARTWTKAECEAMQLTAWANQLEGLWWNARPEDRKRFIDGRPLRDLALDDAARLGIAERLRRLAANPAALKVLTGAQKLGRKAEDARSYRIALDYLVTLERLGKSEAAITEMLSAWNKPISKATILRMYKTSRLAAQRRPGRKYTGNPVSSELARIERANPGLSREDLLMSVSAELRKKKSK